MQGGASLELHVLLGQCRPPRLYGGGGRPGAGCALRGSQAQHPARHRPSPQAPPLFTCLSIKKLQVSSRCAVCAHGPSFSPLEYPPPDCCGRLDLSECRSGPRITTFAFLEFRAARGSIAPPVRKCTLFPPVSVVPFAMPTLIHHPIFHTPSPCHYQPSMVPVCNGFCPEPAHTPFRHVLCAHWTACAARYSELPS